MAPKRRKVESRPEVIDLLDDDTDEQPTSKLFKCGICLDEVPDPFELGCKHGFCNPCLRQHIQHELGQRRYPVKCPQGAPCTYEFSVPEALSILPKNAKADREKLEQLSVEAMIPQHLRVYCPHLGCSALMEAPEDGPIPEDLRLTCHACRHDMCASCNVPWHKGKTCVQFRASREPPVDGDTAQLAAQEGWKACPKCRHIVERGSGCNHITCKCGAEWCYMCLAPYVPTAAGGTSRTARKPMQATCSCRVWDAQSRQGEFEFQLMHYLKHSYSIPRALSELDTPMQRIGMPASQLASLKQQYEGMQEAFTAQLEKSLAKGDSRADAQQQAEAAAKEHFPVADPQVIAALQRHSGSLPRGGPAAAAKSRRDHRHEVLRKMVAAHLGIPAPPGALAAQPGAQLMGTPPGAAAALHGARAAAAAAAVAVGAPWRDAMPPGYMAMLEAGGVGKPVAAAAAAAAGAGAGAGRGGKERERAHRWGALEPRQQAALLFERLPPALLPAAAADAAGGGRRAGRHGLRVRPDNVKTPAWLGLAAQRAGHGDAHLVDGSEGESRARGDPPAKGGAAIDWRAAGGHAAAGGGPRGDGGQCVRGDVVGLLAAAETQGVADVRHALEREQLSSSGLVRLALGALETAMDQAAHTRGRSQAPWPPLGVAMEAQAISARLAQLLLPPAVQHAVLDLQPAAQAAGSAAAAVADPLQAALPQGRELPGFGPLLLPLAAGVGVPQMGGLGFGPHAGQDEEDEDDGSIEPLGQRLGGGLQAAAQGLNGLLGLPLDDGVLDDPMEELDRLLAAEGVLDEPAAAAGRGQLQAVEPPAVVAARKHARDAAQQKRQKRAQEHRKRGGDSDHDSVNAQGGGYPREITERGREAQSHVVLDGGPHGKMDVEGGRKNGRVARERGGIMDRPQMLDGPAKLELAAQRDDWRGSNHLHDLGFERGCDAPAAAHGGVGMDRSSGRRMAMQGSGVPRTWCKLVNVKEESTHEKWLQEEPVPLQASLRRAEAREEQQLLQPQGGSGSGAGSGSGLQQLQMAPRSAAGADADAAALDSAAADGVLGAAAAKRSPLATGAVAGSAGGSAGGLESGAGAKRKRSLQAWQSDAVIEIY